MTDRVPGRVGNGAGGEAGMLLGGTPLYARLPLRDALPPAVRERGNGTPGAAHGGSEPERKRGKTTASVNPAVARTATGRKTLLVEEDAA